MEAPGRTIAKAQKLRQAMSLPEVLLWREIRREALEGLKFRRQHPIGPFVLDFYCPEIRLAVEIDGLAHSMGDRPGRDVRRDAWLGERGVRVLRFAANEVLMDGVLRTIAETARHSPPPAPPGPPPP